VELLQNNYLLSGICNVSVETIVHLFAFNIRGDAKMFAKLNLTIAVPLNSSHTSYSLNSWKTWYTRNVN